ncbi:MAG TPA: 1-phosphofructokinase [Clostridiaceae bacterium]|nr:1-phosphofructokinase [Clostridiaceae bacterium]
MILTVTLNPAVDRTVEIDDFEIGAVNRIVSERIDAGGKGINVSKTIKNLNGASKALGLIGGRSGLFIKDCLDKMGIENEFVLIQGETRTNLKIVDKVRRTNTDINEPGPVITSEDIVKIEDLIFRNLDRNSTVVFSGSVPANTDKRIYGRWIKRSKAAGARTILDADGDLLRYGIAEGPYLCKPNVRELEMLTGRSIEDPDEARSLGEKIARENGIEIMVISMGDKGALFIDKGGTYYAKAPEVEVKSTVGAGDAMVAALAYCLDRGCDMEETIRLSMASAAAAVMCSGSQAASYETIMELEKRILFSE